MQRFPVDRRNKPKSKNCNVFSVGFLGVLFSSVSDWSDLGWPDEGDDATHCPLSLFDKFAWTAKYLIEKQKSPDKKSLESWKGSGNPAPGDQPDDLKPKFSRLLLTPRNPWKSSLAKRPNLFHDFNYNFSSVFLNRQIYWSKFFFESALTLRPSGGTRDSHRL